MTASATPWLACLCELIIFRAADAWPGELSTVQSVENRTAPELGHHDGETPEQQAARAEAAIASRLPDFRFLLDYLLTEAQLKVAPVGIVGHSFGGWTALASADVVHQIRAVVALAPAGSSNPRPGILPTELAFKWGRDFPTLVLVADTDVCLPIDGMCEIFEEYLPRDA